MENAKAAQHPPQWTIMASYTLWNKQLPLKTGHPKMKEVFQPSKWGYEDEILPSYAGIIVNHYG